MRSADNPYAPGAGLTPPLLAGRARELERVDLLLARLGAGRPERSLVLHGLRGVGKTVLLTRVGQAAESAGWLVAMEEAREGLDLRRMVARMGARMARTLEAGGWTARVGEALGTLRSFAVGVHGVAVAWEPRRGVAGSGAIDDDLTDLMRELGRTARANGLGAMFLVDELQALRSGDLAALCVALQLVGREGLPVAVVGAGLPGLPARLAEAMSDAERLFADAELGPLADAAAAEALVGPARAEGVAFAPRVAETVVAMSGGYPYLIQVWGRQVWDAAVRSPITMDDLDAAAEGVSEELDGSIFRIRYERATPRERDYMAAMAAMGDGPYSSRRVAGAMGRSLNQVSVFRDNLIKKGLVFSREQGVIEFTVPLFADYLRRLVSPPAPPAA